MKSGFKPISLEDFVERRLKSHPEENREALIRAFAEMLRQYRKGTLCACGNPLWVIGSAFYRPGCFSCLTGEALPKGNYEIDEACTFPPKIVSPLDRSKFDAVDEVFRDNDQNAMEKLEKIGFQWFDDDDSWEIEEEEEAFPENQNQERLARFFESDGPVMDDLFQIYLTERDAEECNEPLFRSYFRQRNPSLKAMILWGLDRHPADPGLLDDFAYFCRFEGMLRELIERYKTACILETDPDRFAVLAEGFHLGTEDFEFDGFHELALMFKDNPLKSGIVDRLRTGDPGIYADDGEDIPF